jgi:hypothetical protein
MRALIKRFDRFTETAIDDEIVIMRLDNGDFFALSPTAAAIWRLIDGKHDRGSLRAALGEIYQADEEGMTADIDEFLEQMKAAGLLDDD